MELILTKDIEHVGRKGDVVRVKDGFARNFLLPQGAAVPSTKANKVFVEEQKVRTQKKREKEKGAAEAQAEKLSKVKVSIEAQAGEQDKLFGSVTSEEISQALKRQGYDFNKKQIQLKESIRTLGVHPVVIEVYPQVKTTVSVEVVRKH